LNWPGDEEGNVREGYEIYEAYIDGHEEEIDAGQAFITEVRELSTFARKVVRARIARSPDQLPQGEKLWVRAYNDEDILGPWAIEVLEELDEDQYQPIRGDVARGETPQAPKIY